MELIDRIHGGVVSAARVLSLGGGLILLLLMGVGTTLDVVLRNFDFGIPGIWEAVTLGLRWMIGLSLPLVCCTGGNIAVELFTDWLPARIRLLVVVLAEALSVAALGLLAWHLTVRTLATRGYGGVTSDLGLPTYFDWVPLAVGATLSAIALLSLFVRDSARLISGRDLDGEVAA